jgi:hypothetical protein
MTLGNGHHEMKYERGNCSIALPQVGPRDGKELYQLVEQPAVIPNILELNSKLKNNDRKKKKQQQIRESNRKKNLSRFPFLGNCIDSQACLFAGK